MYYITDGGVIVHFFKRQSVQVPYEKNDNE